jgi:hypothetical protein
MEAAEEIAKVPLPAVSTNSRTRRMAHAADAKTETQLCLLEQRSPAHCIVAVEQVPPSNIFSTCARSSKTPVLNCRNASTSVACEIAQDISSSPHPQQLWRCTSKPTRAQRFTIDIGVGG